MDNWDISASFMFSLQSASFPFHSQAITAVLPQQLFSFHNFLVFYIYRVTRNITTPAPAFSADALQHPFKCLRAR